MERYSLCPAFAFPIYEFHISRKCRDKYGFDDTFFSISGDVVFANTRAAQTFAVKINAKRKQTKRTGPAASRQVTASEINAMGIFHEVLHFVIDSYVSDRNATAFTGLESWLEEKIGENESVKTQLAFIDSFPPTSVYHHDLSAAEFISADYGGVSGRRIALTELILLWLENRNPAFEAISEFVDDSTLKRNTAYERVLFRTEEFFDSQPGYGPTDSPLIRMLLAPIEAHPTSIIDQLQFMLKNWETIIGRSPYLMKLLGAIDFVKEEGKYFLMLEEAQAEKSRIPKVRQAGFDGFGEKVSPVMRFGSWDAEPENFSADLSWMPRLVLIAKNIFVWLDQLSKKYQRSITRLDHIPDEELEILSRRGFTGLWLIGIWRRSAASQKIKHLNGNWDAIASAYSLDSYEISPDLGGDEGYKNLRNRAGRYGVRLASDMVPNHMGIDSTWVINHPDWFLKSEYPPYPNYTFEGPDLGADERVGIFIEDGYWTKRDAAVVFKRLDRWTGDVRYIYHGNDGTHMPWNDTAQLDFTKPEVREAVIQTILHVARLFPIIRFDAAMVLSKKHYQRLWFPEPGTGGAIPSRSNFAMSKEQFDSAMPVEFWREVVDRIQKEAPDTLLLAEAFWLMEGYFVRTLGMHRVYNSAFMNMLKREENSGYRQVIKNVLEYNPQILKRFVNFVNNPDEDTAIAQFGKDDKYFGVCVMMATLPGLPMFGHGQVEGLTEKYGMEFRKAYRDELADDSLIGRHEREIFPLLRMRQIFSEVDNFLLYDLYTPDGVVNEDVFAYSNAFGESRSLVVCNNRYSHASGWIKTSAAFRGHGGRLTQKDLFDGLGLTGGRNSFLVFRDVISGIEFIRPVKSLKRDGLFVELDAYKYNVFVDFREVVSSKGSPYDELCAALNGRGVNSVDAELYLFRLRDVHAAFYEAINAGSLRYLMGGLNKGGMKHDRSRAFSEKIVKLTVSLSQYSNLPTIKYLPENVGRRRYESLLRIRGYFSGKAATRLISKLLPPDEAESLAGWRVMLLWLILRELEDFAPRCFASVVESPDSLRFSDQVSNCFAEFDADAAASNYEFDLVRELLSIPTASSAAPGQFIEILATLLKRESTQRFIGVNEYQGVRWFNKERFTDLVGFTVLTLGTEYAARHADVSDTDISKWIDLLTKEAVLLERAAGKLGFRFDDFISELA